MRSWTSAAATPPNMSCMPPLDVSAACCARLIIASTEAIALRPVGLEFVEGAGRDQVLERALVEEARIDPPREIARGP